MRRLALATLILATTTAAAAASERSDLRRQAKPLYAEVAERHGTAPPAATSCATTYRPSTAPARPPRVSCAISSRCCAGCSSRHPRPPAPRASAPTPGTAPTSGALPDCTWRPESGGDYDAVNPVSGAYGKYQVIPSTWTAHCSDLGRDPAGQDECAQRVYAAQGASAWVNC